MTNSTVSADYSAITNIGSLQSPCTNTAAMFDVNFDEATTSAIDLFIVNCKEINILWVGAATLSPELARLCLLGYVSAIESFLRTLFRSIINTDLQAEFDSHSFVVPFGAALYHKKSMMAEALMEGYSFAGEKDIRKALSNFLAITNLSPQIKGVLEEYEKICHLRHCCVHRFGKLGAQNGIALGLAKHSAALEKPLNLDHAGLSDIASWLMSFAKTLNNYIFRTLLDRSMDIKNPHQIGWSWAYSKDWRHFQRLYNLFATQEDAPKSPTARELYERFKVAKQRIQR